MSTVPNAFDLSNEVAIVTGASRGIGKAILHTLANAGATVIGTATSEAGANAITEALASAGFVGKGIVLDVSDAESIESAFAAITEEFGQPGIIVNNAGITRDNLLMRMKEEEWDDVINTNLTSIYRIAKQSARALMKARKGRIINITSIVGVTGNAGQANYCAAKAGVIGLTKSMAKELASRNITVNAIAPGFIDTDMTKALPEATRNGLLEQVPLGRLGDPNDIANAVLFLATPAGAYITGETLHVNGGMFMP